MTYAVTIPLRTVGNNGREHWRVKAKRVANEKRVVGKALAHFKQSVAHTVKLPAVVRLTRGSCGVLDDDNLRGALKGVRDAVASALGVDDGNVTLVLYQYAQAKTRKGVHDVTVEVFGGYRLRESMEAAG